MGKFNFEVGLFFYKINCYYFDNNRDIYLVSWVGNVIFVYDFCFISFFYVDILYSCKLRIELYYFNFFYIDKI